jgi:hypothetical protein
MPHCQGSSLEVSVWFLQRLWYKIKTFRSSNMLGASSH